MANQFVSPLVRSLYGYRQSRPIILVHRQLQFFFSYKASAVVYSQKLFYPLVTEAMVARGFVFIELHMG